MLYTILKLMRWLKQITYLEIADDYMYLKKAFKHDNMHFMVIVKYL